jgi:hypothetical protein
VHCQNLCHFVFPIESCWSAGRTGSALAIEVRRRGNLLVMLSSRTWLGQVTYGTFRDISRVDSELTLGGVVIQSPPGKCELEIRVREADFCKAGAMRGNRTRDAKKGRKIAADPL